ncbi:hypothetical protein ACWEGX_02525 [Streptomyces chartreusis]
MTVGGLIGAWLARRTPEQRARLLVLTPALTGGVVTAAKGMAGL